MLGPRRWLVEEHQRGGMARERGNRRLLLLTAGKLREVRGCFLLKTDGLQKAGCLHP